LRVMARTLHSDFRRDFTTDPPCIPVAPWTAMILVMIFIDEYLGGVERVDLKQWLLLRLERSYSEVEKQLSVLLIWRIF
jgi:hypothetical protein